MVLATASAASSLAPALFQTFATVSLGYMLTRFHVIPAQGARAMALYVSMLAYPSLVFFTLANLDFSTVKWPFFWSTFVSRTLIFILSAAAELFWHGVNPDSIADAGIYGIFTSMGNDLAMGVAIMQAIFGATHPTWPEMLYIVTLIRVMINPFGFYMMEYGRMKKKEKELKEDTVTRAGQAGHADPTDIGAFTGHDHSHPRLQRSSSMPLPAALASPVQPLPPPDDPAYHAKTLRHILTRVFINPLVISSVAGILANVIFGGSLPGILNPFFKKLGDSFNAAALFVLGVAMHGQLDRLNDRRQLKTPLWLFVAKSIILPVISRFVAVAFGLDSDLILFAFVLGTLPSSENVPFFAYDYEVPSQHVIAPAMVLGTILAAPVMFVSAQMVNITLTRESIDEILVGTVRVFSAFGLAFGAYFLFILWYNRRWTAIRDKLLICLICWQLLLNLSSEACGLDWSVGAENLRYGIVFTARMATRFVMLAMAINEVIHYFRSSNTEQRLYKYLVSGSIALSLFVTLLVAFAGTRTVASFEFGECYLRYGRFQWTILTVVDILSIIILAVAMWKINHRLNHVEGLSTPAFIYRSVKDEEETPVLTADHDDEAKSSPPPAADSPTTHEHDHAAAAPEIIPSSDSHASGSTTIHLEPASARHHPGDLDTTTPHDARTPMPLDFYSPTPRMRPPQVELYPHFQLPTATEREEEQSWAFGMFIFLTLSLLWMIVNLCLSLWSAMSPISISEGRIELLLLDSVMSSSQAIWTWLIFGLASYVKSPLRHVTRWIRQKSDMVINWRSS